MSNKLEKHLKHCDKQFDAIFSGFVLNNTLNKDINEIKNYYHKVVNDDEELIDFYELYIKTLHEVKDGKITLEGGLEHIKKASEEREFQTNAENALQILTMAFLFVISTFLYFTLCTLIATCFAIHPLIGLAALILCT